MLKAIENLLTSPNGIMIGLALAGVAVSIMVYTDKKFGPIRRLSK